MNTYEKTNQDLRGGLSVGEVYMYGVALLAGMIVLLIGGIFLTSSSCLNNSVPSKKCTAGKWMFWGGTILAFYPVAIKALPVFSYVLLNIFSY